MGHQYSAEYAERYINFTLSSPYTQYKNRVIAQTVRLLQLDSIWDLGGHVSGLVKKDGSLRVNLEREGVKYRAVDIVPEYFSAAFAASLGLPASQVFAQVDGVVGDLRRLPLASHSLPAVVSADVIEHIANPSQAFQEMHRVLINGGTAAETFSDEAALFKKIKNMVAAFDVDFDHLLESNPQHMRLLFHLIQEGKIPELLEQVYRLVENRLTQEQQHAFHQFLDIVAERQFHLPTLQAIQASAAVNQDCILGNSVLLVARSHAAGVMR